MRQNIKKYLWLGVGIAVIAWFCVSRTHAEEERTLRIAEMEASRSVAVLPAGVEETWLRYIDKRFSEEIQREGLNLKVRTTYIGAEPTYAYVSLNHPYSIDCNSLYMGFSITFKSEEDDSISANLTGDFSLDYKNEPKRGVSPDSIASRNLDTKLCERIAGHLAALIGYPTHP